MLRRFEYPEEFTFFPDYRAHSGQIVEVLRQLTTDEADVSPEEIAAGNEMMYKIRASDGWTGDAFASELYTLNSDGTRWTLADELYPNSEEK